MNKVLLISKTRSYKISEMLFLPLSLQWIFSSIKTDMQPRRHLSETDYTKDLSA